MSDTNSEEKVGNVNADRREIAHSLEAIGGTLAVILWFPLFGAGLLIDSAPYRTKVMQGAFSIAAVLATICFYTPLNVALLTLLAGFTGGCLSRVTYCHWHPEAAKRTRDVTLDASSEARRRFMTESPFTSTMRSFLVYLTVIGGLYVTTNGPFDVPTQNQ